MEAEGDWAALLERAVRGDRAARDEIVGRSYDRVRAIVHRELQQRLRPGHRWILPLFSTSDVVQEVLTDVVRRLDECDFPSESAFVGYLATAVRNHLVSAVRFHQAAKRDGRRARDAADPSGAAADVRAAPDLSAYLAEQAGILRDVLDGFPHRHRMLLELRLVEETAFPAIAAQLGYASAETARQAFCQAQAKLVLRLRARGVRMGG